MAPPPHRLRTHDGYGGIRALGGRRARGTFGLWCWSLIVPRLCCLLLHLLSPLEYVGDSGPELCGAHVSGISTERGVSDRRIGRIRFDFAPTTQALVPAVANVLFGKPAFHLGFGELRVAARARRGTHINEFNHACLVKQRGKIGGRRGAMADGNDSS